MATKKFGTGGNVNYSYGGKGQANKQRTRFGSSYGYKLNAPDSNNDKYAGLKTGGTVRTDLQKTNVKKTDHGQAKLFNKGGAMKHDDMKQDMPMIKKVAGIEATKVVNKHEKKMHGMACGGKVKKMAKGGGIEIKGKTKGRMV